MATITTETPEATDITSAPALRRRRSSRSEPAQGGGRRRTREPRLAGDALVTDLTEMVDRLIEENRQLKRELAKASRNEGSGGNLGQATKTLSGLQRRVSRALSSTATPRRRAAAATAAPSPRPRRRVTDPEVLERRRQALVKARAARQAKREAAAAGS
jgi:hypothetical protein